MIQESDEKIIRNHLLGNLTEEELSRAEQRLLADDDYFEMLTVIEEELIDDYVSGDLTGEDRKQFEAYFLSTPARREKVGFAQTLKEYASRTVAPVPIPAPTPRPVWWKQMFPSPYFGLAAAAAAVIVIAVGFATWPWFPSGPEASKGMAALKEAYRDQRPVESRITGFDHAPPPPVTRGAEQEKFDYVARDRAQALIQLEASEHPDAQSYHDLGRLYLTQHEFDKAIAQFEKALKLNEKNAQLHSDYGAALLEKGKDDRLKNAEGKSGEEFALALEHLTRAIELDGSSLEALFNRATLYQYMTLPDQAEEDWQKFIEKEPKSKWADEARQNLEKLKEKKKARLQNKGDLLLDFVEAYKSANASGAYELIRKNTEAVTGQMVWWQLLGAYLDRSLKGQSDDARQYLRALFYAGELQEQKSGDRFISDLARVYEASPPEHRTSLSRAHALINQAHALLAKSETDQAIELYKQAKDIFDNAGDEPESRFTDCWIGYCHYRKSEFARSLSELSQLAQYSKSRSYFWLQEQALTLMANIQVESNQFSKSIASYNQSLEISEKINDAYNIQRNLSSLAHVYKNLGDRREPLKYMQRCLQSAEARWPGVRQMYRNYYTAAGIFTSFGHYTAAGEYEKAALRLAIEENDPIFKHQSYLHLGAIYSKLQDYAEGMKYLELSFQAANSMDENTRLRPMADSSLQLSHIYRLVGDYDRALDSYDEAIKLYEGMSLFAFLYEAHKGRLLCHIAQGNDKTAGEEMRIVLALFEEHRSKIKEEKNRNSFFDLEQSFYDIAIDFEYSITADSRKAFEYSEASRARSLLDMISAGALIVGEDNPDVIISSVTQPLTLDRIQAKLSEQAQILQYAALNDRLLIWVVSRNKFEVAEKKIALSELTEKVFNYCRLISDLSGYDANEARQKAEELYEILIRPVEPFLEKDKQICIVPDKILHFLPFNALVFPGADKYLINDYLLSFAPSSSIFLICSQAARERSAKTIERVLSVGDPHFNRDAFPDLPLLASSGKEAESIADFYESSCCLVGANAKKERISSEMEKADVIHLASHYVIDDRNPMCSKLLFTKGSKSELSDSVLRAYEICRKKLTVTRLVALSACQTGGELYYKSEGMIGMSRTFLAAGVPLVAASLWPVDSDPTTDLMISFHKYRKREGLSTAKALRQAQLDMIDNPQHLYDRPCYWASFILIGGYASF